MLFDWVGDGTAPFVDVGVAVVLVGLRLVLVSLPVVEVREVDVLVGVGLDVDEEVEVVSGVEGAGVLGTPPEDDALAPGPSIQYLYFLLKSQLVEFDFCFFSDGFHLSKSACEISQKVPAAWQLLTPV